MNIINTLNLMFYLTPFVVMGVDRFASKVSMKMQISLYALFCITFSVVSAYTLFMPLTYLFSYIPSYLFAYYTTTFLITTVIHNTLNPIQPLRSITRAFLITYFSSFYWEFPENIYWQIKLGFNPIITAFCLFGCFSFIYLKNTVGWKKTTTNYALLLTSWVVTALGVGIFILPSSAHCDWRPYLHPCAQYYVFCRIVSVVVLIKIFILDHYLPSAVRQIIREGSILTYIKWILHYALKGSWRLGTEMAYWDSMIKHKDPDWVMEDICEEISDLVKIMVPPVRILELGPGPRSRLTTGYDKGLYDLVAVDPLANDFIKHLGGRDFLVQGTGEDMWQRFQPESFDIAYASNVLDHTSNPQLCMNHLVYLTKVGGYIIIQGNINEGTRTDWQGLHKYDIWIDGENLICKTQHGKPFKLNIGPIEFVTVREDKLESNHWFSILYRRTDR